MATMQTVRGAVDFVIADTFDAPRKRVWKAWTQRDELVEWFGPKDFKMTRAQLDLRPGGTFHYCLRTPDAKDMWGKFVYREIAEPERIVMVNSFSDDKGNLARHPMVPDWPREMLSTTTFEEKNGKTTVTVRWAPLKPTPAERRIFDESHEGMNLGWRGTFEQLAEHLRSSKA